MPTNGVIPDALLVYADGTQRLRVGTASRWALVRSQVAARFGWTPAIVSGGGYRSLQQQVAIFTARYVRSATGGGPFGDVRWWNGVRYIRTSSAGAAAVPGTSNHGLGAAVDVAELTTFGSVQRAQFATVAATLGFSDAEGRAVGEAWHWVDTRDPDAVIVSNSVAAPARTVSAVLAVNVAVPSAPPAPSQWKDHAMRYLVQIDPKTDGRWFLIDYATGTAQMLHNGLQLDLIRRDPTVNDLSGGPQPVTVLDGLKLNG